MSTTYRALDSGFVRLVTPTRLGPISSNVVAKSRARRVNSLSLTGARAGHAEEAALDPELGRDVSLVHELETQDGLLRVWSGFQPLGSDESGEEVEYAELRDDGMPRPQPVHFAGWSAGGFDLLATRYSGHADDFLTLFDDFSLQATPDGIVCVPLDTRTFWFIEPASIIVDVPGTGVVEIFERVGNQARRVPRHNGTRVPGGEIFVGERGSDHQYLVHVGDSTVAYLSPDDPHEPQAGIDFLSGLHVSWTR